MPFFEVRTNVPADKVPEEYHQEACSMLSKLVNRKEELCNTILEAGMDYALGGNKDPVAHVIIRSITMEPEKVNEYASVITEFVSQKLGIPDNRIIINFYQSEAKLVAKAGKALAS